MQTLNDEVKKSCKVLIQGGIILYPTDTVWGIGCDATNEEAVAKIYRIKQRADHKSFIILLDTTAKLDYYVEDLPEIALDLIELSEKPLTIVYSNVKHLANNLIADDGSVGIRITKEDFSAQLCRQLKKPLVSTSANISGEAAPRNFSEITSGILQAVDYVVDYRRDEKTQSTPSSIIKLGQNAQVEVVRK
jgi:L-threonylcarbamoyladenylate synthase